MSDKEENQTDDPNLDTAPESDRDGSVDAQSSAADATDEVLNDVIEDSVPETRDEEMERLREAAASADKRVLQAQAEAENFRKRMRRDFEDQVKYAPLGLVQDILQVRDNLLRALEAAETSDSAAGLQEGVAMVAKQLDDQLAKHGVKEIPTAGELFDPNYHEAISQMPSAEHAEGMVAHVAVTGFQMHERVVRPSQVVVSTGPAT